MVVLVVFMILTAAALERSVTKRAVESEEAGLQLLIYSLLAAVDRNRSGLSITIANERLFESRLMTRNSGLNAMLYNQRRELIWRSRSMTKLFPDIEDLEPGDWRFEIVEFEQKPYFRMAFSLQWPDVRDRLQRYDVVVWQQASRHFEEIERFRQTLWTWLIVTTTLLLILMYLIMMWSLRPLKQVGREVKDIEDGKQTGFENRYPREITPLTENLNILLNREQLQRERYRNAMDDLAHSLKTPLAVVKGFSHSTNPDPEEVKTMQEQVDRMNQIISYQLQKATNVSGGEILRPINISPMIDKLVNALVKVYRDKPVKVEVEKPEALWVRIDEGDSMEVFGNILDNAFKYCTSRITIKLDLQKSRELSISIEDDGVGLNPEEIEKILKRGTRLDEVSEGQGIGLAVVADIVKTYGIDLRFDRSALGGLYVRLIMQGA